VGGTYGSFDRMKDKASSFSNRMKDKASSFSNRMRQQTAQTGQNGQSWQSRMQYISNEPQRAVRRVIRRAKRRNQNAV